MEKDIKSIDCKAIGEPYKGLRPYEEENQGIFFGREQEKEILIDKIFANKLTLLFAATGVGKSSLLQASVIPELKRPEGDNLDVVYYIDWVSDPIAELKNITVKTLQDRRKKSFGFEADPDIALKDFFQVCATFSSDPLVIILDQFEEFFQYQKYKDGYIHFIEQFSACVKDRLTPVVFVISMREDFALELNAFKDYLSSLLFENYFRLEKLNEEKAKEAICKPVVLKGFRYEEELLNTLIKDLADREREGQLGESAASLIKDSPTSIEPPFLQIVCSQLWEEEKGNPDKNIRLKRYKEKGSAKGYVDAYFKNNMAEFSLSEKKIASAAFNHLVTPRGTKIAYPVNHLSGILKIEEKKLENILDRLCKSRILRSRKSESEVRYELYHDIFSSIIYGWNEKFKKQRMKGALIKSGIIIFALALLFIFYNVISNLTGHYLRLSANETISGRIEIYKGTLKATDIFHLHEFQAESSFERNQVEPDKLFTEKQIGDFDLLNEELMGYLPLIDRISAYWDAGEIAKAFEVIEPSLTKNGLISEKDLIRSRQIIELLSTFGAIKFYTLLNNKFTQFKSIDLKEEIVGALATMPPALANKYLLVFLGKDKPAEIRVKAALALGKLGSKEAETLLIELIKNQYPSYVRGIASSALGTLKSEKAVTPLLELLKNSDEYIRHSAISALGNIGSDQAVAPLLKMLKDPAQFIRRNAAEALGNIGSSQAVAPLIGLLHEPDKGVRYRTIFALGNIGGESVLQPLLALLQDSDSYMRSSAAESLGKVGSDQVVPALIKLLHDPESDVRSKAASALGDIKSERSLEPLLGLLQDKEPDVRSNATSALGKIGSAKALKPLLKLLQDPDSYVQKSAIEALAKLGNIKAVKALTIRLTDKDPKVRNDTARILEKLTSRKNADFIRQSKRADLERDLQKPSNPPDLEYAKKVLRQDNIHKKIKVAEALSEFPSKKGNLILLEMLNDRNIRVRLSVITSIGKTKDKSFLSSMQKLIQDQNANIREVAVEALAEIAAPESMEVLKKISINENERIPTRFNAIVGLSNIQHPDALQFLIKLLDNENEAIEYHTVMAIGKNPPVKNISGRDQLIRRLKDKLKRLEERKVEWRKIRDERTESYNEKQMKNWIKKLRAVEPKEPMEFELAFALSCVVSENEGIKLLGHPLANVREGAWMGLGKSMNVSLIRALYQEREKSHVPWFRHAAYRAIDYILIDIEVSGRKEELNKLNELYEGLIKEKGKNFYEGVRARMKWTMECFNEVGSIGKTEK
ncbi:MAG: HEAT repeat domain-containing protein [Candidatus Omnitrophota bacterium]